MTTENHSHPLDSFPQFIKPYKLIGKSVVLRNASISDAEFILGLRTDPIKSRYLSTTKNDLTAQREWLEIYNTDNNQIYLIIEDLNGTKYGTIRLYDKQECSFCWGSWILRDGRPSGFALESALIIYRYAIHLGFKKSHFDVRKENERVWQFHERFGATRIGETNLDYLYTISNTSILNAFERYKRVLPNDIKIIEKLN